MYFHKAQEKPRLYGSFADRQYSIWRNLEDVYGCDHESEVLIMPLFWGLPVLDYSGYNNHGTNYGATYKDGSLDFDGNNDYINFDSSLGLVYPFTFCCHFYPRNFTSPQSLMDVALSSSDSQRDLLYFRPDLAGDPVQIFTNGGGGFASAETTQGISASGWHYACGIFAAVNNRSVCLDGGNVGTNTVDSASPTGRDRFRIGIRSQLSGGLPFDGLIGDVRVSKVVRTPNQVAQFYENPYGLYRRVAKPIWSIPAVGGIEVSATIDPLLLTENVANVNAEISFTAGIDALAITEYAADVNINVSVIAGVDALSLVENAANVNAEVSISAGVDALVITEAAATIEVGLNIQAGTDALVLTENPANINAETNISAGIDALALTENTADINLGVNVSAGVDALAIAESVANVNAKVSISAEIDALTLTEYAANINAETNISASIDTLILSSFAANIKVDIDIQATLETLIIAEYSASVETGAGSTKFISEQLGLNQIQGLF